MTYNTVRSQARSDTECVLVAQELHGSVALHHLCAPKRIRRQVSHVILLLVSSTSLLFQCTTARSTTWTARPSPRRHCTPEPLPQEPLPKTSANAIRSKGNAKESLSHPNYEREPETCSRTLPRCEPNELTTGEIAAIPTISGSSLEDIYQ